MLVEPARLAAALGLPPATAVDAEPLAMLPGSPERVTLCLPGAAARAVVVRRDRHPEAAANHAAVLEALTSRRFPFAPRLLAIVDGAAVEECAEGLTALAVVPAAPALEAAVDAVAALHALPLREGLRWDLTPGEMLPASFPLHRLGFAAHEREAAAPALTAAREALLAGPFGFCHGCLTADRVLLTGAGPRLVGFEAAGHGPQLFDLAAFLVTAGVLPPEREALARRYADARGLDPGEIAALAGLAEILWGVEHQLGLPRRQVELLGDDAASEAVRLAAARVEAALRAPSGGHPAAEAIRAALWPA